MFGASLSRWTMSYFAAALAALLGAEVLMVAGVGFPSQPVTAPQTLVLVHLVAIGWLSLLISGALIQFVPVLVTKPLAHPELPAVALALLTAGLGSLLLGFLGMAGFSVSAMPWLPLGAIGLASGFALNLWNLGRTLWSARPIALPARFVAAGLLSLVGVVTLGTIFSLTLGGWMTNAAFLRLTSEAIPLHAALGLGGWLTFTAMGVSYRLLAMFMLAPEAEHRTSRIAFAAGAVAILVVLIGGPVCLLIFGQGVIHPLLAAFALALVSIALYGHDIVRLYRTRKRPRIELNARVVAWALGALGLAALLLLAVTALGPTDRDIGGVVFLFVFGWLTGLGLAKLYKIVAFLTWLECYGGLLGKRPTPRVQDLVNEPRAMPWFSLYFAGVGVASLAAFLGAHLVFRCAAFAMLIATAKICFELVLTRNLAAVPEAMLPNGHRVRLRLHLPIL
ncbi:hypothetical protein [Bradyrhizobium betae]|uniref:Uncharacterized protein n=1 Tax=Bradyrhizobium betae TaxID=244734 RepID=A0A5P6P1K3_9BRAD|nr:hypothetical protein [Bradyrhizobium betae]MCS3725330.1 hypothetical protein [Bradyrhizobium betae]QFI71353.1 hypothetical protein F8237_02590 [Bradyrhizobium betae]